VAAEILKSQVDRGECRELYFFRDQQGLEVDFLIPRPNAGLWPVEAKASKTVTAAMAASLLSLQRALGARAKRLIVAHRNLTHPCRRLLWLAEWKPWTSVSWWRT